jgi:hypothetical protein
MTVLVDGRLEVNWSYNVLVDNSEPVNEDW